MIMNLFLKYFLLIILIALSTLSISITDLFILWFIMEITNFMYISHLALLSKHKTPIFLYFLIQIISSFILIITLILNNFFMMFNFYFYLMMMALMMKIGIPPFHFWMVTISIYLNWSILFLLLTVQKFIPLYFYSLTMNNNFFLLNFMILMCMIIPMFMSLNLLNYKKLLVYSSINQTGWMIMLIYFKSIIWLIYFFIYSCLLLLIMYFMSSLKLSYYSSINFKNSNNFYLMILMLMFNLSGMPPFSFFLLKWYNIFLFTFNSNMMLLFITMMISSLIMMYIYINMMMTSMFMWFSYSKYLNLFQMNINNMIYLSLFITLFLLIMMSM